MNVVISESHEIRKESDMESYITFILERTGRSKKSIINEWKGHNMLYYMHLFRNHTCDANFEDNPRWYVTCIWWILSRFYFIFEL